MTTLATSAALSLVLLAAFASAQDANSPRSFATGTYRNAFREIGKTDAEIAAKLDAAWKRLFHGDGADERVYFPVGDDMAYVKDVGNDDVRTEGMSYGMMIAVQLDHKDEFDRLWKWAKTHMRYAEGPMKGYFAWQCDENGVKLGKTPASDGEEYFATALLFAAGRWGGQEYRKEADDLLHLMLHREDENGGVVDGVRNLFDRKEKQVVFVPNGDAAGFTDPSYHLPAFYEIWARWGPPADRAFWRDAARVSRAFLRRATHPVTGLFPEYATFDGKPKKAPWDPQSKSDDFGPDAFRVGGNIAMDWLWFGADPWQVEQSNRMLDWLAAQRPRYVSGYTLDGRPTADYQAGGHVAMNAVAAMAATTPLAKDYVRALWDAPVPRGKWRYYDGLLYLFGLLHASGHYRIWSPKG